MDRRRLLVFIGIFIWGVCGSGVRISWAGPGSCADPYVSFPVDKAGKVDWPHPVRVLKNNVSLYRDAASYDEKDVLSFNKSFEVNRVQGTRVEIKEIGGYAPLGWVERSDLLCALTPLRGVSGLEQKLFIKTATEMRGDKPSTVRAYPSPDLQGCQGQDCRELSRFNLYFIFDTMSDPSDPERIIAYLLGNTYRLEETNPLVGWIDAQYGFLWDTAYGIRPKEELAPKDGAKENERTVCAYADLDDAVADRNCQPILGGERWYKYTNRIPLLDRIERNGRDFYQVVLPLAGTGAKQSGGKTIRINPELYEENKGIQSLFNMKKVDVLFLIDGTASMEPYIDAIRGTLSQKQYLPSIQPQSSNQHGPSITPYRKEVRNSGSSASDGTPGVVQQIIDYLQSLDQFKETQFRFGFRMYRDAFAGDLELGQGLALPTTCDWTRQDRERNIADFNSAIAKVKTTVEVNDDYAENMFGGIDQAVEDLFPCPDHSKMLFIIGDCGYSAEAQKQRGRSPISVESLVKKLKGSEEDRTKTTVTFFLQTPDNRDGVKNPESYTNAYSLFTTQAREILQQVLGTTQREVIKNYLIGVTDTDLNAKILAGVQQFSNAGVINEIEVDLRGGASLVDAIERLRGSDEYNNLPALFWENVKLGSCQELGEQCYNRVYDTILEGYVPVSDDLTQDVWLTSKDLTTWTILLNSLSNLMSSGSELRDAFTFAIKDSLERVLRKPLYEDTGEDLKEFLKRKSSLPVRENSPLFSYSVDDLKDKRVVPDCEIRRLMRWISNVTEMLGVVSYGDSRPVFTIGPYQDQCSSGEHIPNITTEIRPVPLGNDPAMRYDHNFQKVHVYWVPEEFLP